MRAIALLTAGYVMPYVLCPGVTPIVLRQYMNHSKTKDNFHACGEQVASKASSQPQYQQIKLAMDVLRPASLWCV
jgi:hypothetical protein